MPFLDKIKNNVAQILNLKTEDFSYPPNSKLGDLSYSCFSLAQKEEITPMAMATKLAEEARKNSSFLNIFSEIKAVGPYLNFYIKTKYLAEGVIKEISQGKKNYGRNKLGKDKKIMVEYSNANTHKEIHVGHLRNLLYGDAVSKLLAANGYLPVPVSYINDFGIHTAKTIWNWQRQAGDCGSAQSKGYLLGKCYSEASQILKKNPEYKDQVSKIMKQIESRSGETYEFWQETRQWSIDYFAKIYEELGIRFTHIFYESEMIEKGYQLVKELLADGILKKSDGAIIADLEQYDLGVLPIIRSDGTALYPVADLALATVKFKDYVLDESIYVVDVRQSLYFKQLFKILELAGYRQKLIHLAYDFVTLPGGMMSSRDGNVITYEELKSRVLEKISMETRIRHEDWTDTRVVQVARSLMVSIIKFEMLKVRADKIITFNIEVASNFSGQTACYLQYGYARLKSILRKQGFAWFSLGIPFSSLKEIKEKNLLLKLAKYPEIIISANQKHDPSELTKYLFELVQLTNDYYHEVNILKAETGTKRARIALVKAIAQVLENGFNLLGMKTLEEM